MRIAVPYKSLLFTPAFSTVICSFLLAALSGAAQAECENTRTTAQTTQLYSEAWGTRFNGQRLQSSDRTAINASNASKLRLSWVYGLSTDEPRSYPLVSEDTIFIGDGGRGLVALDKANGCLRWVNDDFDDISTAILPASINGKTALVFAERRNGVYAVDASSGSLLWHNEIESLPRAMFSGSPLVHKDKVFVPLSSQEIALSVNPFYGCCKTSGGMAALDVTTGKLLWYRPTIEEPAKVTGKQLYVVNKYGPSGAPVWASPMLDTKRGLLYFGTGQNYSHPTTSTSDAIFAVNIDNGELAWASQFTANDAYNLACEVSSGHPNCPTPTGPDFDFGAPPILVRDVAGQDLLYAGQKSGDVFAINPDTGATVWSRRLGVGGKLGGVHWGMAANPQLQLLFIPISDAREKIEAGERAPGLYALDLRDGTVKWALERRSKCKERECWTGLSAAISAGPDIVVTGGLDGQLEVVQATTGKRLWSFDTAVEYESVNSVDTKGGVIDAHGPMLADDLLIVSSGYGSFFQEGGNALLVFSLAD